MCQLGLKSNIPLPELPPASGKEAECSFQLSAAREPCHTPGEWFHHWCFPDGKIWLAFARVGPDYLLRFPELADFVVSADGKQIRCLQMSATPVETIRHLLLDQVIPLVLSKRGELVLHASAVETPRGAIAFLGTTGWGKSTLAASFSEQGFRFLTDDCLLLKESGQQLVVIPSYPGLRLWPEAVSALFEDEPGLSQVAHYTVKKRVSRNGGLRFSSEPVPLRRMYFLVAPEEARAAISINAVSPREAFIELVKYAYVLDITDRERLKEDFQRVSRLAVLPLFYRVAFPRDFSLLPAVRQAILDHLREAQGGDASGDARRPGQDS